MNEFINKYPYTDYQQLNLDWVYKQIQENTKNVKSLLNVDIGEYVNDKIDEFYENGTLQQMFSSTNGFVTPEMFGGVGDGSTDDSESIIKMFAFANENSLTAYFLPDKKYYIGNFVNFTVCRNILQLGTIYAPNGVRFTYSISKPSPIWVLSYINSLELIGLINGLIITTNEITTLRILSDSTDTNTRLCAYNTFILSGWIKNMYITNNGGYINENIFMRGRINNLTFDGTSNYKNNNNIFLHSTFEACTLNIKNATSNYFIGRYESAISVYLGEGTSNNHIVTTYTPQISFPYKNTDEYPTWYNDEYGLNLLYNYGQTPFKTSTFELSKNSFNFDISKAYRTPTGIHLPSFSSNFIETDYIDITKRGHFQFVSSKATTRLRIDVFDADKNLITSKPAINPYTGGTLAWNTAGYYVLSTTSAIISYNFSRYNSLSEDSGVSFIKIYFNQYSGGDVTNYKISYISPNSQYKNLGIENKALFASGTPINSGDYPIGTMAEDRTGTFSFYKWNGATWEGIN